MKRFKTVVVWAMLALWLPVTNHCRLEQIPALSFLTCCGQEGGNSEADDCQTDGCDSVEKGFYRAAQEPIQVILPLFALIDVFAATAEESVARDNCICHDREDSSPPELPRTWQFSFRAAASPRAPSFTS